MKQLILFMAFVVVSLSLFAQNAPVAVDDTIVTKLGETVTVNVINNDYHPDGIPFRVNWSSSTFTDSTITYFIDYDKYWNYTLSDTIILQYQLIDDNGNVGYESSAILHIIIDNNNGGFLDINNVNARVQSAGIQFWRGPIDFTNVLGYEFPKGSKKSTIFDSGIWFTGFDENDSLITAAERYRQYGLDYWGGPISVLNGNQLLVDTITAVNWNRVWKLSKDQIIYHKQHYMDANYQPVEAIATWPAHGNESLGQAKYLAPFVDVDGDSIYNPMNGDYPLIRGDQCIFFIINDVRAHNETQTNRFFGLEIHVMAYEFYNPDTLAMHNTVFYSYKIFNRSQNSYHNVILGLFTDLDIGYAFDDLLGCDVAKGLFYGYNDSIDGDGEAVSYGDTVPAQTVMILSGAEMDADDEDNPSGQCDESINGTGFGDGIIDNERYGMNRFVYFYNGGSPTLSDPNVGSEYNMYLHGLWKDGTALEYGGNGHVSGGAYGPAARFAFPGISDPCYWGTNGEEPYGPVDWTYTSGGFDPGDIRGVAVSGSFTFEPGSMKRMDVAYVSAFAEEGKTALETVLGYSDFVKAKYMEDPDHFGYQYLGIAEKKQSNNINQLHVWPNPVTDKLSFSYDGNRKNAVFTISTISGKTIFSGQIQNGETVAVDMSKIQKGLYIINVNDSQTVYTAKVIK